MKNTSLSIYNQSFKNLKIILYKTFSINGMCIKILGINPMNCPQGWSIHKHKHSFYEFHYVCDGECFTTFDENEYKISGSEFYIIPPGISHSHRQPKHTYHRGFALRWLFSNKNSIFINNILKNASFLPLKDNYNIFNKFIDFLKEANCLEDTGELQLQLSFFKILLNLSKIYSKNNLEHCVKINYDFIKNSIVSNTVNFLEENYPNDLHVKDIANAMHISYSHLSRLFKKYYNITIMEKLMNIRMEKAKELLLFTNNKLLDIAVMVGLKNQYYFINCFKKYYNVTPGKFRELNKSDIMQ